MTAIAPSFSVPASSPALQYTPNRLRSGGLARASPRDRSGRLGPGGDPPSRTFSNLIFRAMRPLKTLERVLSKAGLCSRTQARSWIGQGRVRVNARPILNPDHWVDLDRDQVTVDNRPLRAARRVYLLLYKPKGYLTTRKDPRGRPTIYDLLENAPQWVVPAGRLDRDTSGLLLVTNDTAFAERVTNPDHKVPKTYLVKTSTRLTDEQLEALRSGVTLKDGPTRPAQVHRLRDSGSHTFFEITLTEGRNRQVRRMVEAVGSRVLKLVRTAIGGLRISDLPVGKWRELTPNDVSSLAPGRSHSRRRAEPRVPRPTAGPGVTH